ncbi:hypothetical protein SO802_030108 [Lithocarpus litseifolius]|uniref:F-box domain-containing protein n=1 Tax=Lithocarpus litseifolius TaxID=425828 RepID=A0AAW2BYK2_9ROSI
MSDRISELPDDILTDILSSLTLRDSVKARLLSPRWRHISAPISTLQFDLFTMFGIEYDENKGYFDTLPANFVNELKPRFLTAVDQFLQQYRAPKIGTLKVHFCLGNEYASHIDNWVAFAARMEAKKIDFYFSSFYQRNENYSFPCHLLNSHLKHLRLGACTFRPSPEHRNLLSSLATLDLSNVILDTNNDVESILSGCLNLECLVLRNCRLPMRLCIHGHQLFKLKTLIVHQNVPHFPWHIELNSIDLETFEFRGFLGTFTFVAVPCLEKVNMYFFPESVDVLHSVFNELPSNLPRLQNLSLTLGSKNALPIPEIMPTFTRLKQLELSVLVTTSFDLLPIIFILNASPILEKFYLKLRRMSSSGQIQTRECSNRLHLHLKDIRISGFYEQSNVMEVAIYLLKNAVALERMVVDVKDDLKTREKVYDLLMKEKVNSRVELIVNYQN